MFLKKVRKVITALVIFVGTTANAQNFKVVLDAGHGGKDFGAVRNNFTEKRIVLDVTLKASKTKALANTQRNVRVSGLNS